MFQASKITMKHNNLDGSSEEIAAMESLRAIATATGYSADECFAYSREYLNFETNQVSSLIKLYSMAGQSVKSTYP